MPPPGKRDSMTYIIIAVLVIMAGIAATGLINVAKSKGSMDIRAKAGVVNTLKFKGSVQEIRAQEGIVRVSNVEFLQTSRSGPEKNYGVWSVVPPEQFDMNSLRAGMNVEFAVESSTFNVASKSVVATSLTVVQ